MRIAPHFRQSSAAVAFLLVAVPPCLLRAETPKEDPDALFEEANRLMDAGRDAEACPLLERSLTMDSSLGTRLNLAICYEKIGRLGSAYRLFRDVAQVAHDTGKAKREETAHEHLEVLRSTASFVSIAITNPADDAEVRIDGAVVRRDDYPFTPLDPGKHVLEAIAARKKPFSSPISIESARGENYEITIPALDADRIVEKKEVRVVNVRRTAAFIAGGVGAVGVVTALVSGIVVVNARSTADDHCQRAIPNSDKLGCDADGSSAVKRGQSLLPINAVAAGVGVLGLGLGVYLLATSSAPRTSAPVALALGPRGLGVAGRF